MSASPEKAGEKVTEEQLRALLERGDPYRIIALLKPHPSSELKHLQKMLTQMRTELRKVQQGSWHAAKLKSWPLLLAGVLCSDTPAQAAGWLGSSLFDANRSSLFPMLGDGVLVDRHDNAWVQDLALRLAEKLRVDGNVEYWRFVSNLATSSGALPPITPAYVTSWIMASNGERWAFERHGKSATLKRWLLQQPRLRECVAGIFTTDGLGLHLVSPGYAEFPDDNRWPLVLRDLAAEGHLDRGELIDACADRLLRGGRPGNLTGYIDVFDGLAPTHAEIIERRAVYQNMATSAAQPVAKLAQQALRAVDTAEPGEPMDLAELTEAMMARPEIGLATTQLAWLDAAIKRDRGTVDVLLPSLGAAFAHPATTVQQRALKLAAKHLKAAGPRTVAELRDAALSLNAGLKGEADALFAPYVELAPVSPVPVYAHPDYQPMPLPPMPGTPEELATAFAPCFTQGDVSPLEAEQILAAVAVLSYRDREGLAEVFRPLNDRYWNGPQDKIDRWEMGNFPTALLCLFDAILGKDRRSSHIDVTTPREITPKYALVLRIQELTDHLLQGNRVPMLLATPTESNGAIDPEVLAARLATYRDAGVEPLRWDLEQAELRTTPDPLRHKAFADIVLDPGATDEELGKPDAAWIWARRDAPTKPTPETASNAPLASFLIFNPAKENGELRLPQPRRSWTDETQSAFGVIALPHDPDVVAGHLLNPLHDYANDVSSGRSDTNVLPTLAETAGTPGPLTHLALVYGLAADRPEHRIAAQDAVLTLASRALLQPAELGRLAAIAWQHNLIRANRLIDSLSRLEESGAAKEIFAATTSMVGVLTKTPDLRGLPDAILLATRCAVSTDTRGVDVPGLPELAALTKPKRVGVEARRLQAAIAGR